MNTDNVVFAFIAYAVAWVVLFGYLLLLARRQADLRTELEELVQRVQGAGLEVDERRVEAVGWPAPGAGGVQAAAAVQDDQASG